MKRKLSKIVFRSLVFFIGGSILFFIIWMTVNLWPRAMEPELWDKTVLALQEEPSKNGWNALSQNKAPRDRELAEMPSELDALIYIDDEEISSYWEQAKNLQPTLNPYLEQQAREVETYRHLLSYPQFIDNTQPILNESTKDILYLNDLHKIGVLHVIQHGLQNNFETAYDFLLKMLQTDLSLAYSGRSLVSRIASVSLLKQDIQLLAILRRKYRPENWDEISGLLKEIRWDDLSFKRTLIFEYRLALSEIDAIASEESQKHLYYRLIFNRPATRKLINDRFRIYETLLKDPDSITEEFDANLDRRQRLPRNRFWWFENPGGKLLVTMLIDMADSIKEFYAQKSVLKQDIAALISSTY